ncbi:cleavage protein [Desulfosporosinus sp. FKA]|nr:cleavage protein [Desulfosporosinus sp. FKA]
MTRKMCALHCLYGVDGRCRLEHLLGDRGPNCPHYEEDAFTMSRGRI